MVNKKRQNFWADPVFVTEIQDIQWHMNDPKRKNKKNYSTVDITAMIIKDPLFQEIKKKLTENENFTAQIKIQMDRKRGKFL